MRAHGVSMAFGNDRHCDENGSGFVAPAIDVLSDIEEQMGGKVDLRM